MKRILWVVTGAMLVGSVFLSKADMSQAAPPASPNPGDNGNPASTVNPPGLAPLPPGWAELPPPFRNNSVPPGFGIGTPLGQRDGFVPPGQTQTPPGQTVTAPGETTDDDDIP